jgi:hypothetical protein
MNANIFKINYTWLLLWNVATFLRATVRMKWLNVVISPLIGIYDNLLQFRDEQLYKMSHNSQVVYLEKVLNDKFDYSLREIYIKNSEVYEPVWFYDTDENKPVYHYDSADEAPVYYYDQSDFENYNSDFEVIIPNRLKPATPEEIAAFELQVKMLVDYYKLYSKRYIIKYE